MVDSCCEAPIDTGALHGRQRRVLIIVLVIIFGSDTPAGKAFDMTGSTPTKGHDSQAQMYGSRV